MGMYTELHFNAELKEKCPQEIIGILMFMTTGEHEPQETPKHELFNCPRWKIMLRCDSYYFDADTHSTVRYDDIAKTHYLCIRCNLKNYNSEIEKFVGWITPYLAKCSGDFLGFSRYEETETPTLIYMP